MLLPPLLLLLLLVLLRRLLLLLVLLAFSQDGLPIAIPWLHSRHHCMHQLVAVLRGAGRMVFKMRHAEISRGAAQRAAGQASTSQEQALQQSSELAGCKLEVTSNLRHFFGLLAGGMGGQWCPVKAVCTLRLCHTILHQQLQEAQALQRGR